MDHYILKSCVPYEIAFHRQAYEHNENATYTHEKVINPIVMNSLKIHHQVKNNQRYDALAIMNPSFLTSTPRPSQA